MTKTTTDDDKKDDGQDPAAALIREHPERFDYGDIETDERRNSAGMDSRVADIVSRFHDAK